MFRRSGPAIKKFHENLRQVEVSCANAGAPEFTETAMDPREQALMVFGVRVAAMIAVGAVCAATAVVGCMVTGAAVNAVDSAFFGCPEGQSKTSCAVVGGLTGAATAGFGKIPGGASAVGSMLRNGIEEGVHGIGVEYLDTGRITPGTIGKSVAVGAVFGGAVRMGSRAVRRAGMPSTNGHGITAGKGPHRPPSHGGGSADPDMTTPKAAEGSARFRSRLRSINWADDTGAITLPSRSEPKLIYEANPKHGLVSRSGPRGEISRAPRGDCQLMLECSTQVGPRVREGIEPETGLQVIFRQHREFEGTEWWHGYVPGG